MNKEKKSASLDDLLANIERKQKGNSSSHQSPSLPEKSSISIDSYLDEIQSNIKNKQHLSSPSKTKTTSQASKVDDYLDHIQAKFKPQKNESKSSSHVNINEDYLDNMTKNFQGQRQKTNTIKQQENLQIIQQEELNKQRRHKQLTIKAKEWLKKLNPNSDEGFWFEQFADSYDSRLEAAIDYLEALSS